MATIPHRKRIAELLTIFSGREEFASLGQLTDAEERRLAWGVKHSLVKSERRPWPGPLVGTCIKTWYVRIGF